MNTRRHRAARLGEDDLLSLLYQQLTELQAAQFAPGYDMTAGLDRYRAWLGEHAEEHSRPEATQPPGSTAPQARTPAARADWDIFQAMTALYIEHYQALLRLAIVLVYDVDTAEEIVQDAFNDLHASWRSLPGSDHALPYLRRSVVNRSASVRGHRDVMDKIALKHAPDLPATEQKPATKVKRPAPGVAWWALPPLQREAVVLRYYARLSPAQIASDMGISIDAVNRHIIGPAMRIIIGVVKRRVKRAIMGIIGVVKRHAKRAISSLRAVWHKGSE